MVNHTENGYNFVISSGREGLMNSHETVGFGLLTHANIQIHALWVVRRAGTPGRDAPRVQCGRRTRPKCCAGREMLQLISLFRLN